MSGSIRAGVGIIVGTLACMSLHAQLFSATGSLERVARPDGAPATISEACMRLRGTIHTSVILIDIRDSSFLIPIAGNTPGNNGTYFKSDVIIANYRSVDQRIGVGWMAASVDNTHGPLMYFNIPARTTVAQDDFVATALGKSGLGAILVFGVDSLGSNDAAASLDGFSRIWTLQPGSLGSVSQTFDAVSLTDSIGSLTANIVGLKQSSDFRTNVGIVNLDQVSHTWTMRSIQTGVLTKVLVPPYSVVQSALAGGSASVAGNVALTVNSDGFGFWWSAYGTSVDNRTGDGWVARAKQ